MDNGNNGANLGFEEKLWKAADKLRSNMDAAEYKHVVLGLIFLKYISDSFEEKRKELEKDKEADLEDRDEYTADNIFWVPKKARWEFIQSSAKQPEIGKTIDNAMDAIEKDNPSLKGVLPKEYTKPGIDKTRLGELVDLIATIGLGDKISKEKDILGQVYEYFLGQFASAEGKNGGQFYTPKCIVKLLVEMIEPYKGRVYDPCCGSGGMFVQSEKFVKAHGGKLANISVYGEESNHTTWRLCKMNLAIRGIEEQVLHGNSFHNDKHKDLRADFILANPPFNDSDWGGETLRDDPRWEHGIPPSGNANFAWVQHFIYHLSPTGIAGFLLANGSLSSNTSGEGEIRKGIVEADLIDCIVAMPSQLFYNTMIPVSVWFVSKDRKDNKFRDRRNEVLFIDARNLGSLIDRRHKELNDAEIAKISSVYHTWRGEGGKYHDMPGFCKSIKLEEIQKNEYVLTPGRYVGVE
jgi:type I restriction enzyme M protein